jgi:hypothetical protein
LRLPPLEHLTAGAIAGKHLPVKHNLEWWQERGTKTKDQMEWENENEDGQHCVRLVDGVDRLPDDEPLATSESPPSDLIGRRDSMIRIESSGPEWG